MQKGWSSVLGHSLDIDFSGWVKLVRVSEHLQGCITELRNWEEINEIIRPKLVSNQNQLYWCYSSFLFFLAVIKASSMDVCIVCSGKLYIVSFTVVKFSLIYILNLPWHNVYKLLSPFSAVHKGNEYMITFFCAQNFYLLVCYRDWNWDY